MKKFRYIISYHSLPKLMHPDCALFWEGDMYRRSNFFGLWRKCHCELHQMELYIRKSSNSITVEKTVFLTDRTKVELIDQKDGCPWIVISDKDDSAEFMKDNSFINDIYTNSDAIILKADEEDTVLQLIVSIRSAYYHNETISMADFDIVSVIGRGNFGKVTLVRRKDEDEYFALKAVHKMKLIETNQTIQSTLSERTILSKHRHPFIVSMKFAFQSATKFYIGMEFLSGGDLRNYMKKLKEEDSKISEKDIRIYLAEIALALQHLHECGIVYRDLKPENVMIADDGHIKMTDFGLSKEIGKDGSARSMCGTLEYIAPEIVTGQSYSFNVDWWSLGILAYELLFQRTPFGDENRGRMFAKIVHEDVSFPKNCDPTVKDFVKKLLTKDPSKRWSFERLKDHAFWEGLDFDDILLKKHTPGFVPNCGHSVENFNNIYTKEEPVDSFATPPIGVKSVGVNGFSFMNDSFSGSSPSSPPFISSNLIPSEYDGMEIC